MKIDKKRAIETVINYLSQFKHLNQIEIEWLENHATIKKISKGDIILNAGDEQEYISFNLKGLFKYYYIDYSGKERIKYFCCENNFILSIGALLERKQSPFFIEALEDATVLQLPAKLLNIEFNKSGLWHDLFHNYLVKSILEKEQREADFLMLDGETRYKNFITKNPNYINRLKQYEIASYLGLDPAHLSRIRSNM